MTLLVLIASLIGTFNNIAAVATLQFAVLRHCGREPDLDPAALDAVGAGGREAACSAWR